MKYIISIIIFLLLISSGVLGYGYYRQHQELASKNVEILELEVKIRNLQGEIQKLNNLNSSLQQEKKEWSETIVAKEKRIAELEKFIADNKLNVPQQISAEKSSGKDVPEKPGSDVAFGENNPDDVPEPDSSSLWYWIIFAALLVMISVIIVICKMRKKSVSKVRENKKFICPSCGWEYRKPVTECENCKTRF